MGSIYHRTSNAGSLCKSSRNTSPVRNNPNPVNGLIQPETCSEKASCARPPQKRDVASHVSTQEVSNSDLGALSPSILCRFPSYQAHAGAIDVEAREPPVERLL